MQQARSLGVLWFLVVTLCAVQAYSILRAPDPLAVGPGVVAYDASRLEERVARLEDDLARLRQQTQSSGTSRQLVAAADAQPTSDPVRALERRVLALEARTAPRVEQDPERRRALQSLFESIRNGDLPAATALLANVDVNAADDSGNTPLILAASSGSAQMVEALVAQGASLELRGARGLTPLLAALESDQDAIAALLLDKGSNPLVRDKNGENALIWAAHSGNASAIPRLLAAGLDVNAKSFDGNTAIADAVRKGHVEVIRRLVRNGADVNVRNRRGESVLDLAKQAGDEAIIELLVELGAQ